MEKDTVVVYWACHTIEDRSTITNLLWEPPKPLLTTLPSGHGKDQPGNYRLCAGASSLLKNTFVVINPKTATVTLSGPVDNAQIETTNFGAWIINNPALKNRYRIDYDFGWVFFSEESLEINVTPPYMHKTSAQETGQLASGRFNIGKWFRPANLTYILWENENTLTLTEGEPAMYFEFLTDKKVVLKQFEMVQELNSITNQVTGSITLSPKETLTQRYARFIRSNRHKRVLKLIKNNLLE
jgi:hypothetical protein